VQYVVASYSILEVYICCYPYFQLPYIQYGQPYSLKAKGIFNTAHPEPKTIRGKFGESFRAEIGLYFFKSDKNTNFFTKVNSCLL